MPQQLAAKTTKEEKKKNPKLAKIVGHEVTRVLSRLVLA